MTTLLPLDAKGHPVPALRLKDGGAHSVSVSATSNRNTAAFDAATEIISLYATGDVYIKAGDSGVTATASDHFFPAGVYYDVAIGGGEVGQASHIAVLRADVDCTLYISEKL